MDMDSKLKKENSKIQFKEKFESFRSSVLELLVSNTPLFQILDFLVLGIEDLNPGCICSILLIEENKLQKGSAPHLPEFYNEKIYGLDIGVGAGSCGTAAALGKRVIVDDINSHPYWIPYKEIANKAGLSACWSEPILSSERKVIGTFAIYNKNIMAPTSYDIQLIEEAASLASIAIEKTISSKRLEESEKRFRDFFDKNSSVMLIIEPSSGNIIDANRTACKYYGYPHHQIIQLNIKDINTLPEPEIALERILALEEKRNYFNFPHKLYSGEIREVEVHSTPIESNGKKLLFSIIHDITERKLAETKVNSLLKEKEIILKEVHHRIKNNMSVIYNLLELQTDAITDTTAITIIKDAASRIKTMAVLYDKLYLGKDFHELSLEKYLPPLAEEILSHFPGRNKINFSAKVEPISLRAERLQPIGIITNEILTNIMKYAFTGKDSGEIYIRAFTNEKTFILEIQDNGNGIPENYNVYNSDGFGLTLVRMLTKQLKGKLKIESNPGTKFIISFYL